MGESDERLAEGRHDDGNFRLSFSKVDKAETCLHWYDKRYNQHLKGLQSSFAGVGTAAHGVAEDLMNEHIKAKRRAPLDRDRIVELLRDRWLQEQLPGGESDFAQTLSWLHVWAGEEGVVDYREVIGVEVPFSIELKPGLLLEGLIDRVDRVGNTAIVIDYKTNRHIYSEHDLETGLQFTIYALAVREMYPWAEHIELKYWMFRHGIAQTTTRSYSRISAVRHYLCAVGEMLQALGPDDFAPRPNPLCAYCPHFEDCPAMADVEHAGDPSETLAEWAREYATADALERAGKSRRYDAQRAITALLKFEDGAQTAAGWTFDLIDIWRDDQSPKEVCERIAARARANPIDVAELVCKVKPKSIEDALNAPGLRLSKSDKVVLSAEIEAMGTHRPSAFFSAKKNKRP